MLRRYSSFGIVSAACMVALFIAPARSFASSYTQTNLVSNMPGVAATTDPNLVNPWGVAFSATSPFWVSDQGSGVSTLYDGAGNKIPLTVTVPGSNMGPSGPTGQVFNSNPGFALPSGSSARFIFDTLNGTIAAWAGGTSASTVATTPGASYTGLAINNVGTSTFLYAADSAGGSIHVFNSSWSDVTGTAFAGKFTDPNPISGYVPFNVQSLGSNVFVTYAKLSGGDEVPGSTGYVDEFDASGNFIKRIATGGALDAPWGIVYAPGQFGPYSNDLLIGNFGDGEILAFDPNTDAYLGMLVDANGNPIVNDNLWALATRTGGTNNNLNAVYFTAGIDNEQGGLFGEIAYTPEPGTLFETGSACLGLLLLRFKRR